MAASGAGVGQPRGRDRDHHAAGPPGRSGGSTRPAGSSARSSSTSSRRWAPCPAPPRSARTSSRARCSTWWPWLATPATTRALLRELSASYVQLARVQGIQGEANVGDIQAARRTLGEAEKLVARLLKLDPDGPESLHEAVLVERYLALSFLYEAAYAPAQQHARRAVELAERAVEIRPDFQAREDLADARRTLANCSDSAEEFARSQADLRVAPPREAGRTAGPAEPVPGLQVRRRPPLPEGRGQRPASTSSPRRVRSTRSCLPPTPRTRRRRTDLTFSLNQLSWGYSKLGDLAGGPRGQRGEPGHAGEDRGPEPGRGPRPGAAGLRAQGHRARCGGRRATAPARCGTISEPTRSTPTSAPAATAARTRGPSSGSTELELGDLRVRGRAAERRPASWYRQSAAVFGELAARGALRSDSHREAEKARRAAGACAR